MAYIFFYNYQIYIRMHEVIFNRKTRYCCWFWKLCFISSLISAKLLKITTIIHEQNSVMGKSNRILSKIVDYIALSYKNTKFCKFNKKVFYTGMPIRSTFYKKKIKKNIYKKQILIIGGSQGARVFSTLIPNLFKKLDSKFKKKIFICQQTQINQKKHLQNLIKI